MWSGAVSAVPSASSSVESSVAGHKPPFRIPHTLLPPVLWNVQHSPHHREGIYLQREWLHSQQPLPWSCSSHRNCRNSPHIIFPSGLMCFTLSALDGNTEMQSSPLVLPGEPRPETPEMEQLNKPGRSSAFHQGTQELSMGNTQGKAQPTPALPLWRAEKVMPCFPLLTGKKVSAPESFTLSVQAQAFVTQGRWQRMDVLREQQHCHH